MRFPIRTEHLDNPVLTFYAIWAIERSIWADGIDRRHRTSQRTYVRSGPCRDDAPDWCYEAIPPGVAIALTTTPSTHVGNVGTGYEPMYKGIQIVMMDGYTAVI